MPQSGVRAGDLVIIDLGQRPVVRETTAPDIGLEGLRALVEDGGGDFRTCAGADRELVVRVGQRRVKEPAESERELEGLGRLVRRNGILVGVFVAEPEYVDCQRLRVAALAREADCLQRTGLVADAGEAHHALLQQAVAVAVELHHRPNRAGGGANLQRDALAVVRQLLEEAADVGVQRGVGVGALDDFAAGRLRIFFPGVAPGRGGGLDGIQARREAGQGQVDGLAVGGFAGKERRGAAQDLVGDLQGRVALLRSAGLEAGPDEVVADENAAAAPGSHLDAAGALVADIDGEGQPVADLNGFAERERLARAVGDGDADENVRAIIEFFLFCRGGETDLEISRGIQRQRAFGEGLAFAHEFVAGGSRAQAVSGKALDIAPDGDVVLREIEAPVGRPVEREGRQDEFVGPYAGAGDLLPVLADGDGEQAAALALLEYEGAGGGAEFARDEVRLADQLVGRVGERGVQPDALRTRRIFIGPFIEQDLEVHGLAGIEGAAVGQDLGVMAGGIVRADRLLLAEIETLLSRRTLPAVFDQGGLDGVAMPAVILDPVGEALRQVGEAVDREGLDFVDLLVVAQEQDVAAGHGLAGDVVGHIDAVAVIIPLDGQGKRVFLVIGLELGLTFFAAEDVRPVVEGRQFEGEFVLDIETAARVGDQPLEDRLLVVAVSPGDGDAGLREVAQVEVDGAFVDERPDLPLVELLEDMAGIGAAVCDGFLAAGELLAVGLQRLAVAGELQVFFLGRSFFAVERVEAALQEQVARKQGDRLPGVVGGIFLIRRIVGGTILPEKGECEECVEGVVLRRELPGDLLRQGRAVAFDQQAPQGVFVVVPYPGAKQRVIFRSVQRRAIFIERDVACALHLRPVLLHISQEARQTLTECAPIVKGFLFFHAIMEQDDRFAETLHFLFRLLADGIVVFPVNVAPDFDILDAGIVEIPRQVFGRGLFLDLLEDADLVLGTVGVLGLSVVCPEAGQDMAVLVLGASVVG